MDLSYSKYFINKLALPDELCLIINEYARPSVLFKQELLNKHRIMYYVYVDTDWDGNQCLYLSEDNGSYFGRRLLSESLYERDMGRTIHDTCLSLYTNIKHDYDYKYELKQKFRELNTIKEFSRLTNLQYGKPYSRLDWGECREFMLWYILHF
jgi:hypothetical protein